MSSTRFYDYWESYGAPHESNLNQYLGYDDLTLSGKFLFLHNKNMKLSGRARFNTKPTEEGTSHLSSHIDYSLIHTVSPWTKYTLSQQSNELTLDGNFELYRDTHNYLSLFALINFENDDKKRNMNLPSKLHLRYHYLNNLLLSFGVEQYDPLKKGIPDVYSLIALVGGEIEENFLFYGGIYSGFKLREGSFIFSKYLLALRHRDITATCDFGLQKVSKALKDTEMEEAKMINVWEKGMNLKIDGRLSANCSAGGDISYNLDTHDTDARVYGIYDMDKSTFIKGKWQYLENSITLAINHNYRGFINFGVVGKFRCMTPAVESSKSQLCHIKSKFGVFAEFNDTLI